MSQKTKIIYTLTDEAPALATYSLLPIIKAFTGAADVAVETRDISLAARVIANFPERLTATQKMGDALSELGQIVKLPEANIVKLPNVSASIPQLESVIAELQAHGYDVPNYPSNPQSDEDKALKATFSKVLGSAVNPVLREGNSDRRAPASVKSYAQKNPHSMGAWSTDSKTAVASMSEGDFYGSEKSTTITDATQFTIQFESADGSIEELKAPASLQAGEIIDAAVMSQSSLRDFLTQAIAQAKEQGVLFSVHMKATMMKVSDPIIFGQAVSVFFEDVFKKHALVFEELGINANNGFGDVLSKIETLKPNKKAEIQADIQAVYTKQPDVAMVDSDKGITNLNIPSDVIIDASMPAMIRTSGQMWNKDGQQQDTMAVIPDRCYAGVFKKPLVFVKSTAHLILPPWALFQMLV